MEQRCIAEIKVKYHPCPQGFKMAASNKKHGIQTTTCTKITYKELEVEVSRSEDSTQPTKTQTFLNPKMKTNRELVLLTLSVAVKGQSDDVISCLDAFSASGIQALQWKKQFGSKVRVTANDMKPEAVKSIRENCSLNGFQLQQQQEDNQSEKTIEISCKNANIVLHDRPFQFIHLDPFGTAVGFLDAAFTNLPNKGILSVTSTDISAFLGKCPQVTMRHYNGHVTKCEYLPELACRLIVASLVRAAARCNKGLEVLFVFAKEHFVLTVVRVCRGYKKSDESLRQVQRLLHCNLCEERKFVKDTLLAEDNLYSQLPCSCYKKQPGKTAALLGPVWSGSIFNESFVTQMKASSFEIPGISLEVKNIVERMEKEAGIYKRSFHENELKSGCESFLETGKRSGDFQEPRSKVMKMEMGIAQVTEGEQGSNGKEDVTMGTSDDVIAKDDGIDGKREKSEIQLKSNVRSKERTKSLFDLNDSKDKDRIESEKIEPKCVEEIKSLTKSEGKICLQEEKASEMVITEKLQEKVKVLNSEDNVSGVPFYFTVIRHCENKGNWPRMKAVVDALIARGHQASLTIFHQHGVRTTATLDQYRQTLATCSTKR